MVRWCKFLPLWVSSRVLSNSRNSFVRTLFNWILTFKCKIKFSVIMRILIKHKSHYLNLLSAHKHITPYHTTEEGKLLTRRKAKWNGERGKFARFIPHRDFPPVPQNIFFRYWKLRKVLAPSRIAASSQESPPSSFSFRTQRQKRAQYNIGEIRSRTQKLSPEFAWHIICFRMERKIEKW